MDVIFYFAEGGTDTMTGIRGLVRTESGNIKVEDFTGNVKILRNVVKIAVIYIEKENKNEQHDLR